MSSNVSPARPRLRWRSLVAGLSAALLLGAGAAPAQAADVLVLHISTGEVDIVVTRSDSVEFINYEVRATNLSTEAVHLGFGADLKERGITEYFWEFGGPGLGEFGQALLEPGATYSERFLPRWSGMTYSFFRDIDTVPTLLGEFVNDGLYLPFNVQSTVDGNSLEIGYPVAIRPEVARAGESIRIDAEVGPDWPANEIGVWIRQLPPEGDSNTLLWINLLRGLAGGFATFSTGTGLDLRYVGAIPVAAGLAVGTITLPTDLAEDGYGLFLGTDGVGWPGGLIHRGNWNDPSVQGYNLTIEAGAPRGTTAPGTGVPVTPLDQFGTTPVTFNFDEVTAGGTTTVTTSTSGPASTSFTLLGGSNAVYYDLSTTAVFSGNVTVCLNYSTTGLTTVQQDAIALFHYTGGTWANITTTRSDGQVCGVTSSFSPFALGIPVPPYAFEGFLAPVANSELNRAQAGSVVPIRFRVDGNQGVPVIATGSPTSGVSACTVGAAATTSQPATSVTPSKSTVRAGKNYSFLWKTDKSWAGTCRQFTLTLTDGSVHTASFTFTKPGRGSTTQTIN